MGRADEARLSASDEEEGSSRAGLQGFPSHELCSLQYTVSENASKKYEYFKLNGAHSRDAIQQMVSNDCNKAIFSLRPVFDSDC
jgi:hypothetical protein